MEAEKNTMREMTNTSYGDQRLDKSQELNDSMTIGNNGADEYERQIFTLGGKE